MHLSLITYANDRFKYQQQKLHNYAYNSGQFDQILSYSPSKVSAFYLAHKHILDQPRGAGYWLWKPYIIYHTLMYSMDYGDILLYLDCGDIFRGDIRGMIQREMWDKEIILTKGHINPQKSYCKRDAFILMNCDEEKYWDNIQIEAGMIIIKNTENMRRLVEEWFRYCCNQNILTDLPNICGKDNFPEFVDHRHDQAVLNNLKVKYNLFESDIIRNYAIGNYDPTVHGRIPNFN